MTTKAKSVLHTVTTADGVIHTRTSARAYTVAIIIESDPVLSNLKEASHKRAEAARSIARAEENEQKAKFAPATKTEIKVPSGFGWDRTEYLYPAAELIEWANSQRKRAAEAIAEAIVLEAAAANPNTKAKFWIDGWSQSEAQGHKTAITARNRQDAYHGANHGYKVTVVKATRHG